MEYMQELWRIEMHVDIGDESKMIDWFAGPSAGFMGYSVGMHLLGKTENAFGLTETEQRLLRFPLLYDTADNSRLGAPPRDQPQVYLCAPICDAPTDGRMANHRIVFKRGDAIEADDIFVLPPDSAASAPLQPDATTAHAIQYIAQSILTELPGKLELAAEKVAELGAEDALFEVREDTICTALDGAMSRFRKASDMHTAEFKALWDYIDRGAYRLLSDLWSPEIPEMQRFADELLPA